MKTKIINNLHKRARFQSREAPVIFNGDCLQLIKSLPESFVDLIVTSPPYCMGKEYDVSHDPEHFLKVHNDLLPEALRILKSGGSLCWQIGSHVRKNEVIPLDWLFYEAAKAFPELKLRNRIIWTFGHGAHNRRRFCGRYETVLWFTKGDDYIFDLDAVRVPQKYPGKLHYKGPNKGKPSSNPLGKNPGDIWDIPNVKANHIEKTGHPCQFPVALVQRLIRALTNPDDLVFDPFLGSGSAGVAAIIERRRFLGCEVKAKYVQISRDRMNAAMDGTAKIRPLERAIHQPKPTDKVAQTPECFAE